MPESFASAAPAKPSRETAILRPPPRRGRASGLAAAAAGLALLAAAAGCSSSGGADSKPAAAAPTGIQLPAKIASLKKAVDDGPKAFDGDGIPASVVKNLHEVEYYESTDNTHTVIITGGMGLPVPSDGSADKVKRLFSEWAVGAEASKATSVTAGSVGGTAECAPEAANATDLACGWVGGKVALVLEFSGIEQGKARSLVPQILSAVVR